MKADTDQPQTIDRQGAAAKTARDRFTLQLIEAMPHLRKRALGLTHDATAAADLVQDTAANALRSLEQFQAGTNARAWLMRIMFNLFVDQRRRSLRETPINNEVMAVLEARLAHGPPDHDGPQPANDISPEAIQKAIFQLPPKFREPFEMRVSCKLSYQRIATKLGIRPRTVGTRLHRGRQLLRRMLRERPVD